MHTALFLFSWLLSVLSSVYSQQLTIDSFDSKPTDLNYWDIYIPENADSNIGFVRIQYDSSNFVEGSASISLNWGIHNNEIWGGLSRIEHFSKNDLLYDFSRYDSLSIWYNNITSNPINSVEFRIILYDASHSNSDSLSFRNTENYYSFHYILGSISGWNEIKIPLEITNSYNSSGFTLTNWSGITGNAILDKDKIVGFGFEFASTQPDGPFEFEGNILLDDFKVNSRISIIPPIIFSVSPDSTNYRNTVFWHNPFIPDTTKCNIYYSRQPITNENLHSDNVEVVCLNIPYSDLYVEHELISPLYDKSEKLFYVMTQIVGGKEQLITENISCTNIAKGVPVIYLKNNFNFSADGNLNEWDNLKPFRMYSSDGSGTVVKNTTIVNDSDLSADIYLVSDSEYLYTAYVITDDSIFVEGQNYPWQKDSPELFVGLYNWHNRPHTSLERGIEPDYHFNFGTGGILLYPYDSTFIENGSENYFWGKSSKNQYIIEAKIPYKLISRLNNDSLFVPIKDFRIPIDFSINDVDSSSVREGILTYSKYNEDDSWRDVSRWTNTWIWEDLTNIRNKEMLDKSFYLFQNFPNPFNPSTEIKYQIETTSLVKLSVFNILGEEIANLVNEIKPKGIHYTKFNSTTVRGGLSSGIYFYKLQTYQINSREINNSKFNYSETRKMILLKLELNIILNKNT